MAVANARPALGRSYTSYSSYTSYKPNRPFRPVDRTHTTNRTHTTDTGPALPSKQLVTLQLCTPATLQLCNLDNPKTGERKRAVSVDIRG